MLQNHRRPDSTYINNNYINVVNSFDIESKTQNRQETYKTKKNEKLISQNNK